MTSRLDIRALTGLRFVAAVLVLIAHVALAFPNVALAFPTSLLMRLLVGLASAGMSLFFVLSGFVMWLNYAHPIAARKPGAIRDFALARFARLYPMYLVVIAVAFSMAFLLHGWPLVRQILPDAMYFIAGIEAWIPGDNGRLLIFGVPYITHLWSISTELFFYLAFPLIAITFARSKSTKTIALIGLANLALGCTAFYLVINYRITSRIAPGLAQADGFHWLTYYSPYIRLFQFLAGCVACHLYLTARDQSPTRREAFGACVIGYLAALSPLAITIISELTRVTEYRMTCAMLLQILPLIAFPFLMLFLARYSSALCRVLSLRPIVVVGEISYSIYLLHPFVLFAMQALFEGLYQTSVIAQVSLAAATSVLVILMSFATYHLIERPAKRWIRGQTATAVSAGGSPGLSQICAKAPA